MDIYKQISHIPNTNLAAQLYHLCSNLFSLNESDILQTLKSIVTKQSNPADHHLNFSNLYQHEHKTINDYLVHLKTSAMYCEISCPNCSHNLLTAHVNDQFICGMHNDVLQTDILAKADLLKSLKTLLSIVKLLK